MRNESFSIKLTVGENHELALKTLSQDRDQLHYIGLSPIMVKLSNRMFIQSDP